jgi:hypothetical protein
MENKELDKKYIKHDEEIQDLRLLLNVAQQTIKAHSMRFESMALRIDIMQKEIDRLQGIEE